VRPEPGLGRVVAGARRVVAEHRPVVRVARDDVHAAQGQPVLQPLDARAEPKRGAPVAVPGMDRGGLPSWLSLEKHDRLLSSTFALLTTPHAVGARPRSSRSRRRGGIFAKARVWPWGAKTHPQHKHPRPPRSPPPNGPRTLAPPRGAPPPAQAARHSAQQS